MLEEEDDLYEKVKRKLFDSRPPVDADHITLNEIDKVGPDSDSLEWASDTVRRRLGLRPIKEEK